MLIAVLWLLLRDPHGLPESLELFNAGKILQSRLWDGLLVQSTSAIKLRVVLGAMLGAGLDHAIRPAHHKDVVEHRNGNGGMHGDSQSSLKATCVDPAVSKHHGSSRPGLGPRMSS